MNLNLQGKKYYIYNSSLLSWGHEQKIVHFCVQNFSYPRPLPVRLGSEKNKVLYIYKL